MFLGGYLVSALKFNIPEARQILSDLELWLKDKGYYVLQVNHQQAKSQVSHIYIYTLSNGKFGYAIRNLSPNGSKGNGETCLERYNLELVGIFSDPLCENDTLFARIVLINSVYDTFSNCLLGLKNK